MSRTTILLADLEPNVVYELRSRNLTVGVWNEDTRWPAFTGIRDKFEYRYLDMESYVGDEAVLQQDIRLARGTAWPIRVVGRVRPGVDLRRSLAGHDARVKREQRAELEARGV